MSTEIEVAGSVLTSQTPKLMRDFREIQLQRNASDRAKTIKSLHDLCYRSIEHGLRKMTRYNVGTTLQDGIYWLVKALDGQSNFMHGIPFFCSSATLMHGTRPLFSLINLPWQNNLLRCESGNGLHSNLGLHKVTNQLDLSNSMIVTDHQVSGVNSKQIDCTTLSYAYTAYGNFDGFIMALDQAESSIAEMFIKEGGGRFSQVGNKMIGSGNLLHDDLRATVIKGLTPGEISSKKISFCCGPTQKPATWSSSVYDKALISQSHRSTQGIKRVRQVQELIRHVLKVPDAYKILLLNGSATGAIECGFFNFLGHRPIQNISYDIFGHRWSGEISRMIHSHKKVAKSEIFFRNMAYNVAEGERPEDEAQLDPKSDLVFVYTGTTTGYTWQNDDLLKREGGIVICDATSAAFAEELPWKYLDVTCFSFQKALGAEAGLGCVVLSEKAVRQLHELGPVFIPPRIIRLTPEIIQDVADGKLINTISMLNLEEISHNLQWAASNGGLSFLQAKCKANQEEICNNIPDEIEFLLPDKDYRAKCVLCLRPKDQKLRNWDFVKRVAQVVETKYGVYEICGHPEEVPCWRFWTGPTMQQVDLGFRHFVQAFHACANAK